MRALLVLLLAAALAPAARGGGDFVDLAAAGHRLWFVGAFGVRAIDTRTGLTVSAPALSDAPYPLSIAVGGGAAWVATVQNGYVHGRLARIDLASGSRRSVSLGGPVQYVAAGAGGIYALVGADTIALVRANGTVARRWRVAGAGRMTADSSGCWISTNDRLVHIDRSGAVRAVVRAPIADVATGGGYVWVPRATSMLRVDERTGRVATLRTGRLRLGGFQHDVASGDGALWTVDTLRPELERRDPATGSLLGRVPLPAGIPDAIAVTPGGVWVGMGETHDLLRFDPRTLRRTLSVRVD
jgi:hypothetical protein